MRHRNASRLGIAAVLAALALPGSILAGSPRIVALDQGETPTEPSRYPKELVVPGEDGFDGSYVEAFQYRSGKTVVAIWESGPGVLRTDGYPHDEYCLVLEGKLVVTDRDGGSREFGPGDTFVIPKGWAGTWDMKTRFRKQYVAVEPGTVTAGR